MIFFYGEGRFGNQIFQYQALCVFAKAEERILAIGLEDLQGSLDLFGPHLTILTRSRLVKRVVKYLAIPLFLRPLARVFRVINYAHDPLEGTAAHRGHGGTFAFRAGWLRKLTFVEGGYFHNASLWRQPFSQAAIAVKPVLREAAREYLHTIDGLNPRASFIHIRRGDYLRYSAYGISNVNLPIAFYRQALAKLSQLIGSTNWIFVTDDPRWVEETFGDIAGKVISARDASLDFAIMTECGSAILSNSTFALAAALMMRAPELVIAPKYWFGFRAGRWLPPHIEVRDERMLYLAVPTECESS